MARIAETTKDSFEDPRNLSGLVPTLTRHAYLLTLYYQKETSDLSFVIVQASHCNKSHRFTDVESAMAYLEAGAPQFVDTHLKKEKGM